jgi:hypothetical protein
MKLSGVVESILTIKISDIDVNDIGENKLKQICKEFGFNDCYCIDHVDHIFECFAQDTLFDILKSRMCFLLKRIREEKILNILKYNIKAVIIDSEKNDEVFKL